MASRASPPEPQPHPGWEEPWPPPPEATADAPAPPLELSPDDALDAARPAAAPLAPAVLKEAPELAKPPPVVVPATAPDEPRLPVAARVGDEPLVDEAATEVELELSSPPEVPLPKALLPNELLDAFEPERPPVDRVPPPDAEAAEVDPLARAPLLAVEPPEPARPRRHRR